MFSVNLCIVATGRYKCFLPQLLNSINGFFCCDFTVRKHLWSDSPWSGVVYHPCVHEPWPLPSMHKFRDMDESAEELGAADYTFYLDADSRIMGPINDEIFSDIVAVQHPGYVGKHPATFPYERNPTSKCSILDDSGKNYYIGSFHGGKSEYYLKCVHVMREWLDEDEANGFLPVSTDESAWNKLLAYTPPTLVLPPTYHWPEPKATPRIMCLDKNHAAMRSWDGP